MRGRLCGRLRADAWSAAVVLTILMAVIAGGPSHAAAQVNGGVIGSCTVITTAMNFGSYDPIVANKNVNLDSTATVTLNCTVGLSVTIGLDAGQNSTHASGTTRAMSGSAVPTPYLSYEIYQDVARSVLWCNSGACLLNVGTILVSTQSVIAYGRIPKGQNAPAGNYSDTVIVTANF